LGCIYVRFKGQKCGDFKEHQKIMVEGESHQKMRAFPEGMISPSILKQVETPTSSVRNSEVCEGRVVEVLAEVM
jgi:hypothetical protein